MLVAGQVPVLFRTKVCQMQTPTNFSGVRGISYLCFLNLVALTPSSKYYLSDDHSFDF